MLEKRVKSRFSHRHYYTYPPGTYHDYAEICQNALLLSSSDLESDDVMSVDDMEEQKRMYLREFNRRVKVRKISRYSGIKGRYRLTDDLLLYVIGHRRSSRMEGSPRCSNGYLI